MLISLHKNATTPATRRAIQQATGTDAQLAAQFGVSRTTIRRWRKRGSVEDGSHTPHRLHTPFNVGREEIVVYLRTHPRLAMGDLLAVVREFIEPAMSRSALDRLLHHRGVNRLPEPEVTPPQVKSFKADEPGFVDVDVK
jgi:transposase